MLLSCEDMSWKQATDMETEDLNDMSVNKRIKRHKVCLNIV